MPTVNGKKYPYTKAGKIAAKKASEKAKTKGDMVGSSYNITRNLGY
jgi:hypothetical protein